MKIKRSGSSANHGISFIELSAKPSWSSDGSRILLKAKNVSDFNTHARHDYTIEMELDEAVELLATLATPPDDAASSALRAELTPAAANLLSLLLIVGGR